MIWYLVSPSDKILKTILRKKQESLFKQFFSKKEVAIMRLRVKKTTKRTRDHKRLQNTRRQDRIQIK